MLLHHRGGYGGRDVEVDVDDPDATVADLAAALEPDRPVGPFVVDGRAIPAATPLDRAGVGTGSIVGADAVARSAPGHAALVALTVTGGLDAGRRWLLPPGRHVIGRAVGPDAPALAIRDATVSRNHAVVRVHPYGAVTVEDDGSTNGTWLDGAPVSDTIAWPPGTTLRCGAATLRHGPVARERGRTPATRNGAPPWPWHRRPVSAPPADHAEPISPPDPEDAPPPVTGVGIAAVVGSLLVGGLMVLVLGSWMYALFALLGPVMVVAGAVDGRLRRRRSARRGGRRWRADLTALDGSLTARRADALELLEETHPGPAATTGTSGAAADDDERPREPGDLLWATRTGASVRLGTGVVPWTPPVAGDPRRWAPEVVHVVDRHRTVDGPVVLPLDPGTAVAIVGPAGARRALARSIVVQAAVAMGPADLAVDVVAGRADRAGWAWARWLPHVSTAGPPDPIRLVVVDDPAGLRRSRGQARSILRAAADPTAGLVPVVLVATRAEAPATCTIVEVDADGSLRGPTDLIAGPAVACGTARDVATRIARSLARFEDAEAHDPDRGLPDVVTMASAVGAEALSRAGISARWSVGGVDPAPVAVIGRSVDGPVVVDLAVDGPHALVAGTTGSGKSELLRSLVASLALGSSPDHLVFVLVDFKGGSAFDACARLPHTVGVVTDLDEHLAERALRCLEAELRHREGRLRAAGAGDLTAFRAGPGRDPDEDPLPRLVVVIDEFATLAAELPDFVDSLVGIAQRGRSLGVHLVLATQRPTGAVNDNIRANTSLRIALRVEDQADSVDVVGVPAAAELARTHPGRALVRLGPSDLVTVQTVWTGAVSPGADARRVRVRPLALSHPLGRIPIGPGAGTAAEVDAPDPVDDDLARIVDAAATAWAGLGGRTPRRPWPDPLPRRVDLLGGAGPAGRGLYLGLADAPDEQRVVPFRWDPDDGALLLVGRPGSGTSTGLASVVLAAAETWSPSALHVHVVDLGAAELAGLAELPHVGAVVGADELERQRRLIDDLAGDLARRRARPADPRPRRLLVIDGIGALHERWDDGDPDGIWSRLVEIVARGSEVGIHTALAAHGTTGVPHRVLSACRRRLVLHLADPSEAAALGVPAAMSADLSPGRGVDPEGPTLVQLGTHGADRADAVALVAERWADRPTVHRPRPVGVLPDLVLRSALGEPRPGEDDGTLRLAIGVSDIGLGIAHLVLGVGGHALIAGPPRSGRSTALRSIGAAALDVGLTVVAVGGPRWDRRGVRWFDPDDPALAEAVDTDDGLVVLVDDADVAADAHPVLARLARERRPTRHVVAAGRSDRLRTRYAHWTKEVRADRSGLLLRPDADLDGDLLGTRLPRRAPVSPATGRGWLVGDPEGFAQVAVPAASP